MNTQQPNALKHSTVDYAEWLADKLHNTNDYGKEAAGLLVKQATELTALRARVETAEAEWAALSQDDGKAQREIERLRAGIEAAEGAAIPTDLIERDYAWHYDRGFKDGLKAASSDPVAFSCHYEAAGGEPCKKWCGDRNVCLAVFKPAAPEPEQHTHCNCLWDGETQIAQCTLHAAHIDAIHEWAERAKTAEAKVAAPAPERVPLTMPKILDGYERSAARSFFDTFTAGVRWSESEHGIGIKQPGSETK